jgi:predicted Zn-dependent protease
MDLDVSRVAGWMETLAKGAQDLAEVFVEQRRAVSLEWRDGEIVGSRAVLEEGLSARCRSHDTEHLVFISDASEAGARETIRSLQMTLGRPPLPRKPERPRPASEPSPSLDADRWARKLTSILSRVAPQHRLRWTMSEVFRQVVPAHGPASSSTRRLLSLEGTFTAASRRGDEVRAFSFHAPGSEATADELRAALARAAQPRETSAPLPEGETDVALAGGCAAVFFHEILSHPLEAGQESPLAGLEQARVAVPELEVRDDATRLDLFGGFEHDDEGVRPRSVKLLDAGHLAGRLTDRAHASPGTSNGHGRRAGPADLPLPRGSNVVVAPGHCNDDELARRLASGIWIEDLDGGSVELASGRFRLHFPRARRVRRGRLADESGAGWLAGEILPALKSIEGAVGHEVHPYRALGFCARGGQVVPVGGVAPAILVRGLAVRSPRKP